MKTQLDYELTLIPDATIRTITRAVLDAAPDCFWTMPASTTGKYHPAHSLGEGGLIRHTKAVVHLTAHLLAMEGIEPHETPYSLAIAAAILHDCCKKGDHEQYTAFDHPLRAARLIEATYDRLAPTLPDALADGTRTIGQPPSNITTTLHRLAKKNLVTHIPTGADDFTIAYTLTPAGKDAVANLINFLPKQH